MELDKEQFGLRVKQARKNQGLTQEKLAELIGVSAHFIYEIEKGRKSMSIKKLNILTDVLGVSLDYLVHGELEEAPESGEVLPEEREQDTGEEPYGDGISEDGAQTDRVGESPAGQASQDCLDEVLSEVPPAKRKILANAILALKPLLKDD